MHAEREGRGDPIESFRRVVLVRLSRLLEAFRCGFVRGVLVSGVLPRPRLVSPPDS